MDHPRSVLIIDSLEETREVLRAALEGRGMRILAASRAEQGLSLAKLHRPDCIVMDLELDASDQDSAAGIEEASRESDTPLVILGTARKGGKSGGNGAFFRKPYHYGPLIRKIESLLVEANTTAAPT